MSRTYGLTRRGFLRGAALTAALGPSIIGDHKASALVSRPMRAPWHLYEDRGSRAEAQGARRSLVSRPS
ncbi:MAG: twin-arginine translocation signal domain-containing protein [Planctomycetes bacterium]|nr:twin-arginine translocation signal domain-containing protein [Planctomycetota bacterium]